MKIVMIVTEPSGDFLGFQLMKEIKKKKKNIAIHGLGGELMQSCGLKSWIDIKEFSTIGVFEVLIRIFKFMKMLNLVEKKIMDLNPDLVITIDSPSFSYRLIKRIQKLRESGSRFIHYVAPTVWAWKKYRAKIFSYLYDELFTLFNFEPRYFKKYGLKTTFVGHEIFFEKIKTKKKKKIILFLPGSRKTEIVRNLNLLNKTIKYTKKEFKDFKICILSFKPYLKLINLILNDNEINIITDFKKKQQVLNDSFLAVASSGSVTLELCKFKTPTIVVYDTHIITRLIIKLFVKVKYASIMNIMFNKEIIPEFLFEKFKFINLTKQINKLIKFNKERKIQEYYMNKFSKLMLNRGIKPSKIIVDKIL